MFTECGTPKTMPKDRVVILDPCNVENNVGRRITEDECTAIVGSEGGLGDLALRGTTRAKSRHWNSGKKSSGGRSSSRNNGCCKSTETSSQNYTIADIGKVIDCFAADLDMISQSTGLLTRDRAKSIALDVKAFAQSNYLTDGQYCASQQRWRGHPRSEV